MSEADALAAIAGLCGEMFADDRADSERFWRATGGLDLGRATRLATAELSPPGDLDRVLAEINDNATKTD